MLRWAAWACVLAAAGGGCRTFSGRGPVPGSVATCQQLSQRGRMAIERGEWERAESLLGQAVRTVPTDTESRRHYAEALWHRGAASEAITQLEEARRVAADDATLAVRLGEMCLASGQVERARQAADQALAIDLRLASAWALRGRTWQASGQARAALADFQRALSLASDDRDLLLQVAEAHRALGQPERALVTLQQLEDTYSPGEEPQQVLYLRGLALSALGRHEDAVAALRLAVQRGGPTPDVLCRLAEAQLSTGRAGDARATALQALTVDPQHAGSRAVLQRMDLAQAGGSVRQ